MSSEWSSVTLGEFVRLQRGHDLTSSEQQQGSVPIMGSAGPNGTHNIALAKGPGVVVGRSGASAGRVHFSEVDYWPHNTCLYVTDFLGNNQRFAYYLLQTLDLAAFNSGSAQPSLNRNFLYSISLKVPQRVEQDRIVEMLKALDDRITLLNETNATLEAIAQALFKSWFVDFDPVRAKAEGRQPEGAAQGCANVASAECAVATMDPATAALFPDTFEDSELGPIPKGWSWSNIGESFVLTMGQSPPGNTYNDIGEGLPFYQGRTDFGFRFPKQRIYCTEPSRLAEAGDTLVSVRAPVGDVNVALDSCALGRGVAGLRHSDGFQSFVFYVVRCLKPKFEQYNGEGTVFGSINKKDFESLPVVNPGKDVLQSFEAVAASLDTAIENNEQKLRSLTQLRDTLLPRLISGQLRLPDAAVLPTSAGVSGKTSVKTSVKTSGKILAAIRRNPTITIPELAARIGVAERTIERNLSTLQTAGHLRRVGPAKGGYWEALV